MTYNIQDLIKQYQKHQMEILFMENRQEVLPYLNTIIKDGMSVSVGGSVTLSETGVLDYLKTRNIKYLDRYQENLSQEEIYEVFNQALTCDLYLTSTNAMTKDGYLYNVDRTGNRLAALNYGPKKVIIITGINKLVENLEEAFKRVETIAAPKNCIRLKRNTPCVKTGYCMHCNSEDKLCNLYSVMGHQLFKDRITILLINENLGY